VARVNLIARDVGFGLSRDLRLLGTALTGRGHVVAVSAIGRGKLRKWLDPWRLRAGSALRRGSGPEFDLNLMLEEIRPEYFHLARRNVLLPNPEWFRPDTKPLLGRIDAVFAKTRHAETIFTRLGCRVVFTGFTSEDRYDPAVTRDRAFFHLAGRSRAKNTEPLLALWRRHPRWPRLTVVQDSRTAPTAVTAPNIEHRIDHVADAELRRLQNAHWFALCPSQAEGFGHYLVEALGVGAATLTLDAAPMNEVVTRERGVLVPAVRTAALNMAEAYGFEDASMAQAIERMIGLGGAECDRIGAAARAWFIDNDRAFPERLDAAIAALG